jgi:hypothetical protein
MPTSPGHHSRKAAQNRWAEVESAGQLDARPEVLFHELNFFDAGDQDFGIDLKLIGGYLAFVVDLGEDLFDAVEPRLFLLSERIMVHGEMVRLVSLSI